MIDSKYILALTNNQLEDKDKKYNKKLSEIGKIIKLSKEDIFNILASYSLNFDEMESLFLCKDELIPLSMFLKDIDFSNVEYIDSKINTIYDCYISQRRNY